MSNFTNFSGYITRCVVPLRQKDFSFSTTWPARALHTLPRSGARYGLQTCCKGGVRANVTVIERMG